MYTKVCPVCKSKIYRGNKFFGNDFSFHNDCLQKRKSENNKKRPVRTSTPVSVTESSPAPSFSDSVTDFFYQSWKSGLHSDDSALRYSTQQSHQPYALMQPVCYASPVVYVNTVIFQPFMPAPYVQHVGYRPDGTYGILPTYWP